MHQKDAEIQHWIGQPRTGVAGCCSMDVPGPAQPMSAHCGPRRAVYSAARFWIQARTSHGAKRCSELSLAIQVMILGRVMQDHNKDPQTSKGFMRINRSHFKCPERYVLVNK